MYTCLLVTIGYKLIVFCIFSHCWTTKLINEHYLKSYATNNIDEVIMYIFVQFIDINIIWYTSKSFQFLGTNKYVLSFGYFYIDIYITIFIPDGNGDHEALSSVSAFFTCDYQVPFFEWNRKITSVTAQMKILSFSYISWALKVSQGHWKLLPLPVKLKNRWWEFWISFSTCTCMFVLLNLYVCFVKFVASGASRTGGTDSSDVLRLSLPSGTIICIIKFVTKVFAFMIMDN